MKNLYNYILESKKIKELNIDFDFFKLFIDEWVLSEIGFNYNKQSELAKQVYDKIIDKLQFCTIDTKAGIKALYNFCSDFIDKLFEVGVNDISDEIIRLLLMKIEDMPFNKIGKLIGVGEEGIVIELKDKVIKCFFGDKIKKDKLDFYKACKSGKYEVFPKVYRIGKGYVVMEKLKMYTPKCDLYQGIIDRIYWDVYDEYYNLDDYNEKEQEVIQWLEDIKKAISETTIYADMGDLSEKNFGENNEGKIIYFDI